MNDVLYNPAYNALLTGDKSLALGTDKVKYFDSAVSPFVGFEHDYKNGFEDLHQLLPKGRKIVYAIPVEIDLPRGWNLVIHIKGLQFIYEGEQINNTFSDIIPLQKNHMEQMMTLAHLTKPGPFGERTIEFGEYHGIFSNDRLLAMTGQRMHVEKYTEISAVCTHPDHTGKGYAYSLLQHQLQIIQQQGQQAFLHVRHDNERAIALYERMGFKQSSLMNFYFMKKE